MDRVRRPAFGVGLRLELLDETRARASEIDVVEVMVDDLLFGAPADRDRLLEVVAHVPAVAHGVGLSIGTAVPPDGRYLDRVAQVLEAIKAPWHSEHLAFTGVPGADLGQLLPLPRTPEVAAIVARNVAQARRCLPVPLLLENVSYYFDYPGSTLDEIGFLLHVLDESGAGLLLDVENLYINASNHGYDPVAFIDALPPGIVRGVHVAGGSEIEGILVDTHDGPIRTGVPALLERVLERQAPDTIILERDQGFDDPAAIFGDLRSIREHAAR